MRTLPLIVIGFVSLVYFSSCQKEVPDDLSVTGNGGSGGTSGGTGGATYNASCNNTVMKIKRWQALFDTAHYIAATWNGDGTVQTIKYNVPLSEYRTATYLYQNNRVTGAALYENLSNQRGDTALFHYNAAGLVDSMYLKNSYWFDMSIRYTNGKITKFIRYADGQVLYYWDVETDAKGNVTKAVEWNGGSSGFTKESTYTYTRDDRKNPFSDLAPYMFYLNDEYEIFRLWGPNNYTDQRYQDHTGTGIDLTTGFKFKYNSNCYPATSQQTIMGATLFTDDDFQFTYY